MSVTSKFEWTEDILDLDSSMIFFNVAGTSLKRTLHMVDSTQSFSPPFSWWSSKSPNTDFISLHMGSVMETGGGVGDRFAERGAMGRQFFSLPRPYTNLRGESSLAEPSDERRLADARVSYEDHLKNPLRVGCEAISALGLAQRENELWKILLFHLFCCTYLLLASPMLK